MPAESGGSFRPSPGDSAGEPARKRRGRPSNAQIEQEKAAAAAEGREWQPRPPRPPRKKKIKTSADSPPGGDAEPAHSPIPQTPEIQMLEAEEENSSGKKRRRKAREDPTVQRAAPYDPVRQSPLEPVSFIGEVPPTPQQPREGQVQLGADSNLDPEHHHSTTESHVSGDKSQHLRGDNSQHMQTEQ